MRVNVTDAHSQEIREFVAVDYWFLSDLRDIKYGLWPASTVASICCNRLHTEPLACASKFILSGGRATEGHAKQATPCRFNAVTKWPRTRVRLMQILLTRRQISRLRKSDHRTIDKEIRAGHLLPIAHLQTRSGKFLPLFAKREVEQFSTSI
jgi:hypothetical protein